MGKSSLGVKIESDFKDYYDSLSTEVNYNCVYKRYKDSSSRGALLRWLSDRGINTVELKAAREFDNTASKLVVYTNGSLHDGLGKRVVSLDEARELYANHLAAKYYEEANGETLKVLHVGTRRFRICMKTNEMDSLNEGSIESITEITPQLNYSIMEPIFSIDYISNGEGMVAIDFNRVQNLEKLSFQSIMSSKEVIEEVKKVLLAYNKI